MRSLLSLILKLPPFSLLTFAFRHKRKLPGLIWVGGLGFLAWQRFGPQITERLQEMTEVPSPPTSGPAFGPMGDGDGSTVSTPTMAVADDLAPANGAPEIPEPAAEPDPAPVTTLG